MWERLSSSDSGCAECEKDVCVPVHPSLLLLPSTCTVNLRFKCCTFKYSPLPSADQTLSIDSSIFWMSVLVNRSYAVSGWTWTVVPLALLVQRSLFFTKWRIRKNCETVKSVTDYRENQTCLWSVQLSLAEGWWELIVWTARREASGLEDKNKKAVCIEGGRAGRMMHGGNSAQEWK